MKNQEKSITSSTTTMQTKSVRLAGHATSVRLEPIFWEALATLAQQAGLSINAYLSELDNQRSPQQNLASFVRVHVLHYYQQRCEQTSY